MTEMKSMVGKTLLTKTFVDKTIQLIRESVALLAERQPSSGVMWVRSLPAAPSRCGRGPSGPEQLGWLINQLGNPSFTQDLLSVLR